MRELDGYLEESEKLLNFAIKELEAARMEKDEIRGRQICEKAYLAMLKMINAFFLRKGLTIEELPQTDRGRFYFINKLAPAQIRKNFHKLRHTLHIAGFHERVIDFQLIEEDLEELQTMINEIKKGIF